MVEVEDVLVVVVDEVLVDEVDDVEVDEVELVEVEDVEVVEVDEVELVEVDGVAAQPPRPEPASSSDLLSDQLEVFGRDRVYEEAVRSYSPPTT